jgi:hypothetical protein
VACSRKTSNRGSWQSVNAVGMGACRFATEDALEIGCDSSSKLLTSSGVGAV